MTSDLSVLMPVYNGGLYLEQAIRSVLAQECREFEFLIIDDGSRDASREIIARFAAQDPRIIAILHDRNQGLSSTLNEGLRRSKGSLVVRMDQDDESLPSRLGKQREFMRKHPEVTVAGSFVYHMGSRDRLVKLPVSHVEISETLPKHNCIYHPSVILRREEVLQAGGYRSEFRNAEDYDLWLRLSRTHVLANIPEPLLRYRFAVEGMTLKKKWDQFLFHNYAIAAHANPEKTLPEVMTIGQAWRDRHDRRTFLTGVYEGTLAELAQLGNWKDGFRLAARVFGDVGFRQGVKSIAFLSKARMRNWLEEATE